MHRQTALIGSNHSHPSTSIHVQQNSVTVTTPVTVFSTAFFTATQTTVITQFATSAVRRFVPACIDRDFAD